MRKQLHFNVSLQWISLHAIFGKKTLLFWSGLNYIKVDMYIFNIKSRMQIAHTLLIKDLWGWGLLLLLKILFTFLWPPSFFVFLWWPFVDRSRKEFREVIGNTKKENLENLIALTTSPTSYLKFFWAQSRDFTWWASWIKRVWCQLTIQCIWVVSLCYIALSALLI